jgi:hypothetical protein
MLYAVSQDLSPTAFEALLSSKGLQLKTANEAFWLLLSWVEAQSEESEEGRQALFTRLAKHLHFDGMDPGYILLMVSEHPRIIAAGLQSAALRASLIRSNVARRTADEIEIFDRNEELDHLPMELAGGKPEWTFDEKFTTAEAATIEPGKGTCKTVGLAAGLPWLVMLGQPQGSESEGGKLGLYSMCIPLKWMRYGDGSSFYFQYRLEVGVGAQRRQTSRVRKAWSRRTPVGKTFAAAWEEVFREGSERLVNGELCVRVTVMTVNDQGP